MSNSNPIRARHRGDSASIASAREVDGDPERRLNCMVEMTTAIALSPTGLIPDEAAAEAGFVTPKDLFYARPVAILLGNTERRVQERR
jgi:hypothetical protein